MFRVVNVFFKSNVSAEKTRVYRDNRSGGRGGGRQDGNRRPRATVTISTDPTGERRTKKRERISRKIEKFFR